MKKKGKIATMLAGVTALSVIPAVSQIMRVEAEVIGGITMQGDGEVNGNSLKFYKNLKMQLDPSYIVTTKQSFNTFKNLYEKDNTTLFTGVNFASGGNVSIHNPTFKELVVFKVDTVLNKINSQEFRLVDIAPTVNVLRLDTDEWSSVSEGEFVTTNNVYRARINITGNEIKPVNVEYSFNGVKNSMSLGVGTHDIEIPLPASSDGNYSMSYKITDAVGTVIKEQTPTNIKVNLVGENKPSVSIEGTKVKYNINESKNNKGGVFVSYIKEKDFTGEFEKYGDGYIPKGGTMLVSKSFSLGQAYTDEHELNAITDSGKYLVFVSNATRLKQKESIERVLYYKDTEAPKLDVSLSEPGLERDNKYWFKSTPVVTYKATDDTEVSKLQLIFKPSGTSDEQVVKEISESEGSFELDNQNQKGTYLLRAQDKVGNNTDKEIGSVTPFKVDSEPPAIISFKSNDIINGYFKKGLTYEFILSYNDSGVGTEVKKVSIGTREIEPNADQRYEVDLYGIEDGKVTFTVYLKDYLGNEISKDFTYKVDDKAPTVVSPDQEYEIVDGVLYSNKPVRYKFKAEDEGSGVKGFTLDGVFKTNNTEGLVTETTDVLSRVVVFDNFDNEEDVPFWKLVGKKPFNKIVIDNTKPTATFDNSKVINGYYKDTNEVDLNISIASKKGFLTVVDLKTNRIIYHNKHVNDGDILRVPVSNGDNKFRIYIKDIAGNVNDSIEDLKVDNENPEVKASIVGSYNIKDKVVYAKDKLEFTFNFSDTNSGIDKTQILKGDDEEVISEDASGVVTLTEGTSKYKIKVTDKVGHEVIKSLDEFLSEQGITEWVFDSVAPKIRASFAKPDAVVGGENLYNKDLLVNAVVEEPDKTFESFELYNNGVLVGSLDKTNPSTKITVEGKYHLELVARDKSGNEDRLVYNFTLDKTAPGDLKAEVNTDVNNEDKGVFSKTPINITLSSKDSLTGIKGYWVNGKFQESPNLSLTDGSYEIQAEDFAGNKSDPVKLNSLTGWKSNNIYVDSEAPKIKFEKLGGKWLSGDISNKLSISDNLGIDSYEVTINGIKVVNKVVKDFKTELEDVINSSLVPVNANGRYDVSVRVKDLSGNIEEVNDYFFIDRTNPEITNFEFVSKGYLEGKQTNGSDEYGFYFKDGATLRVHAKDENASSGLKSILIKIGNYDEREVPIEHGYAEVTIPENFKGWITAKAKDNVENISNPVTPSGVITENGNFSISNNFIDLILPSTPYKDFNGNNLYNKDITVGVSAGNSFAGLRSVIVNDTSESYDNRGNSTGEFNSRLESDKNLVTKILGNYNVVGNSNDISLKGTVTDRVGHTASVNKVVSIDKDAPKVSLSYSSQKANGIYNDTRVVTISVDERNFSPEKVNISGKYGRLSGWTNEGGIWKLRMTFDSDGEYQFNVDVEDLAGNKSNTVQSEKFIIDKTKPVVDVSFNNNNVANGKYYSSGRVATITVKERNFDPSLMKVEGGSVSGWSHSGDIHTATVSFNSDGVYNLTVSGVDLAGNSSNTFNSGEFVVDATKPTLEISGVSNGVSYFKDFGFKVGYSDTNLDSSKTTVTLTGREKGRIDIGSLDGLVEYFNNSKEADMDDVYTLKAYITDLAGNISEQTVVFSVNRGGSVFSFLNADYNGKYLRDLEDIVIEESTVDELDENFIKLVIGDKTIDVPSDKVTITKSGGTSGRWVYRYQIDKSLFNEDGVYRIQLFTKTKTGKENSSISQEYVFVVDRTKPKITIGGIQSNGSYPDAKRRVAINVDDLSGVDKIVVTVNGKEVEVFYENGIAYIELEESSRAMKIEVKVTDKAGNEEIVVIDNVFINSSWLAQLVRTVWFKLSASAFVALLGYLIFILFKRRKKEKEDEEEINNLVNTTGSTGSSDTDETVSLGGEDKTGESK